MIKAPALPPGGVIGLVAPSGAMREKEALAIGAEKLAANGFTLCYGKSVGQVQGYLSGPDDLRAQDLNEMFLNPHVDAIVCVKGGYGTPRILDLLDYEAARRHPKPLVGFSDITALHSAYHMKSGLVTLHGPMPYSSALFPPDPLGEASLLRLLCYPKACGPVENPSPLLPLAPGKAEGQLVGGNLTLLTALLGTPYEPDTRGKLLFLEEIGEETYKVDRMLNQLRLAGKLRDCAGLVLGHFTDCVVEYPDFGLTLAQIFEEYLGSLGKPVLAGLCAGHGTPNLSLALGARYGLDAEMSLLVQLEGAVV